MRAQLKRYGVLSTVVKQSVFLAKLFCCVTLLFTLGCLASDWQLIGPEGGNVRSLAYDPSDPNRVLLGTSAGQLFISQDGGNSWNLFAHLGPGDDYVLDHIVFDPTNPATVYAAAWGLFDDNDGGVFRSDDGGVTWQELTGGAWQVDPRPGHGAQRSQHTGDWRAGWSFSHSRRRRQLGAHYAGEPPGDREPLFSEELCVRCHRSAEPGHHLRRHATSSVEDHRRWGELAQPQGRNSRRF